MKLINTLITILFISLLSSPSWSVTLGDLVERDGLYYEKFTDIPFTGEVTGAEQGSFKDGNKDDGWVGYHENGQLYYKGDFKSGNFEGAWVWHWENGQLREKGNYMTVVRDYNLKTRIRTGAWVGYHKNGQLYNKGSYKTGRKEGAWISYWGNGQLWDKGNYKRGRKEGAWVSYNDHGTVDKEYTGTFKRGKKVSD